MIPRGNSLLDTSLIQVEGLMVGNAAMAEEHIGDFLRGMEESQDVFSICNSNFKLKLHFFHRVLAISTGLQHIGLKSGDRVAIAALNSDCYLEWMLGVTCAGGIFAPLNYRWSIEEAIKAVRLIQPMVLIVDEHCRHWYEQLSRICPSICTGIFIGKVPSQDYLVNAELIIQSFSGNKDLKLCSAPHGVALICFTSGTTGEPKGAALSHKALIMQSLAKLQIVGYSNKDVYLHTSPLCHIGGISSALAMVMAGGRHIFIPKFEPGRIFQLLRICHVSTMIVVPTMLKDLLQFRKDEDVFPSMKTVLNGGGRFTHDLLPEVTKMFPNTQIFSAYGMTEAASSMTFIQITRNLLQNNNQGVCVGKPPTHVEIQILHGGNIVTRGPHVMHGYWGDTGSVLNEDGWFDTGDIGRIDRNGNLWLLGRAKDVIKTGGENVYASEVEYILCQHVCISTACVVGIPDIRFGELVAALVKLKQEYTWKDSLSAGEYSVSPHDLRVHCHKLGLSRYKVPKFILHSNIPFPMTSTGKIKKDEVKSYIINTLECRESFVSRL